MENDFKDFIVNCKKPLESENDGKTAIEKSSLFKQRLDETIIKAKSPLENKSKKKTKARNNKNHRVELKKMPLFFKPSKCPKPRKAHTQLANIKKSYHFTQQKY